ncbi:helix-turn-helix domain-containing protein [Cellulomonas flavigena]|uniref:helix-turn-helix domain-containing protein n=1 Tax=Cellulomonas flavigena TaxID=1711 RepID=UPI001EFA1BE2|nr:helix-turn-helix domain-containing protein [Cellulomonas flavigena]
MQPAGWLPWVWGDRTRPRARLGTRAIRWAIRQLRFEGATISGLARQLGTTWNTVWSPIKPCLHAASDDPTRFAGVQVLGVDERRVAPPGPTPTWPT